MTKSNPNTILLEKIISSIGIFIAVIGFVLYTGDDSFTQRALYDGSGEIFLLCLYGLSVISISSLIRANRPTNTFAGSVIKGICIALFLVVFILGRRSIRYLYADAEGIPSSYFLGFAIQLILLVASIVIMYL